MGFYRIHVIPSQTELPPPPPTHAWLEFSMKEANVVQKSSPAPPLLLLRRVQGSLMLLSTAWETSGVEPGHLQGVERDSLPSAPERQTPAITGCRRNTRHHEEFPSSTRYSLRVLVPPWTGGSGGWSVVNAKRPGVPFLVRSHT